MKNKYTNKVNNRTYIIHEDLPAVGVYLYVYEGDYCKYDHLQDSITACMEYAFEEFDVPMKSWVKSQNDE